MSDERLAGQRPRRLGVRRAAAGSSCSRRPPPACRRAPGCAARRRTLRTDAATTGPISGTACSASTGASMIAVHRPEVPRERRRRLLADVADAERVDQPRQVVLLAALDLLDDVAADLAELPRHGALRSRLARRDDQVLELRRLSGDRGRRSRAPAPARSADRPATRPALRCSSRSATRSARGCGGAAPGTTCSRSARRLLPRRAAARSRTPGTSSASPTASSRGGRRLEHRRDDLGMTSPAFSITTRVASRRSLRAMSSALCSVAIEIVEPARNTGSSTAYGVTAPVRPTFTSIFSSVVCACCAGNLNAVAQRGNLAVVPSRSRSARSSTLTTTPSVSNSSSRRFVGPLAAERDDLVDAVAAPPVRLDRQAPVAHRRQQRRSAAVGSAVRCGPTYLIDERAEPALRHQRRIEIPHRPGRGVARVREQRLAGLLALVVHPLERRARQVHLAAHFESRAGGPPRSASGIARIVRTFAVTSSPRTPSPRVAPRTSRPFS